MNLDAAKAFFAKHKAVSLGGGVAGVGGLAYWRKKHPKTATSTAKAAAPRRRRAATRVVDRPVEEVVREREPRPAPQPKPKTVTESPNVVDELPQFPSGSASYGEQADATAASPISDPPPSATSLAPEPAAP